MYKINKLQKGINMKVLFEKNWQTYNSRSALSISH